MAFGEVIIAGNDFAVGITAEEIKRDAYGNVVYDSSNLPVMQPVNLTGASSIKWIMKKHARDASYLVFKSTSNGGISIVDPINGRFVVNLVPTDTQGLDGDYYFEAEVTDASGKVSTLKREGCENPLIPGWTVKIEPNAISKSGL